MASGNTPLELLHAVATGDKHWPDGPLGLNGDYTINVLTAKGGKLLKLCMEELTKACLRAFRVSSETYIYHDWYIIVILHKLFLIFHLEVPIQLQLQLLQHLQHKTGK